MLKEKIDQTLKNAMRAKDLPTTTVLRSLNAAIKSWEIDTRKEIDEPTLLAIIEKQLKQRNEAIQAYVAAHRTDLSEKEQFEASILKALLPEPLSNEEINQIINDAIAAAQASSIKEMGKVMSIVKERTAGRADAAQISALIKSKLV